MNNWIQANKKTLQEFRKVDGYWGYKYYEVEAIPVSSLEELFSKDGEQLAREMYPVDMDIKTFRELERQYINQIDCQRAFLEAYNLQEVKIAELKKEVEELRSQMKNSTYCKCLKNVHNYWIISNKV